MDIIKHMISMRDEAQAAHLSRFFKTGKGQYGEGDKFLGIKVPVTRQIVKAHWQDVSFLELETLISSEWHEVRLCALLFLVQIYHHAKKKPELQQACVDFYLAHTQYINNWDLVDLSCYEILGDWAITHDRAILYHLANSREQLWAQRIGIVSCMALVRHNELDDAFAIADILLHHAHDLIHKAVGWILREAGKRDEARLQGYLIGIATGDVQSRYKVMPRTMLRYAIEKFPEAVRQDYLKGKI